jgi:hypothetical protein
VVVVRDPPITGTPLVHGLDAHGVRERLSRVAVIEGWKGGEDGERQPIAPPLNMAKEILSRGEFTGIRHMAGVTRQPFLRPDGTVAQRPGWDEATGVLLVAGDGSRGSPTGRLARSGTPSSRRCASRSETSPSHRPRLCAAALTLLRACCARGAPVADLRPMGSHEGWTRLIRQCVAWCGLPDPCEYAARSPPRRMRPGSAGRA